MMFIKEYDLWKAEKKARETNNFSHPLKMC
jgi:hypothetical protein